MLWVNGAPPPPGGLKGRESSRLTAPRTGAEVIGRHGSIPLQNLRPSHILDEGPRTKSACRDSPRSPCLYGRYAQRSRLSPDRNQHRARPFALSVSPRTDRGAERRCRPPQEELE